MTKARDRLSFALTEAGKVILRGIVFIALAALIIPAFDVLSVLVCVLLVGLAAGFVFRPRVVVTGSLPERIVAGQAAQLTYRLRNLGRLPAYHLRVRFPALPEALEQGAEAPLIWRLGPGRTSEVTLTLRPRRRGAYQVRPPVCESSFPFHLFHFGRSRRGTEPLIVLPAFSRLDVSLPYVSRHVNASSLRPAGRTGTSPEYIGNRPFQPGDPPRRIDVRAWARLAVPVTKEYDDDLDNYAALVLDTRCGPPGRNASAPSRRGEKELPTPAPRPGRASGGSPRQGGRTGPGEELEAAISLCASMAYTIHRDCVIDLLLAGPELHLFTSTPRALRLDRIQETLAVVEPSPGYDAGPIGTLLEDRLGEISEIIFILLRWDRVYRQLAEQAERAGCHCTVFVVGESEPSEDRLQIAGLGEGGADAASPPLTRRDQQWAAGPADSIRFVAAGEILAGRRDLP